MEKEERRSERRLKTLPDRPLYPAQFKKVLAVTSFPDLLWSIASRWAIDPHTRIHRGDMFHCSTMTASLADNASLDMIMRPGVGECPHMILEVAAGGNADFLFYEACTYTGDTLETVYNHKRYSSKTWNGTVLLGATITSVGTELVAQFLPGGRRNQAAGGGTDFNLEWILAAETAYLIRLTNRSGGAIRASIGCSHYAAASIPDA